MKGFLKELGTRLREAQGNNGTSVIRRVLIPPYKVLKSEPPLIAEGVPGVPGVLTSDNNELESDQGVPAGRSRAFHPLEPETPELRPMLDEDWASLAAAHLADDAAAASEVADLETPQLKPEDDHPDPASVIGSKQSIPPDVMVAGLLVGSRIKPKLDAEKSSPASVTRLEPLPPILRAHHKLSPEQEATQRAIHNPTLWLAEWQAVLKREKLPVSWPATAGVPPDTGVCGCCGTRSWWLNEGGTQGGSQWVCAACHPPPVSRVVQSKWPPTVAPSSGAWPPNHSQCPNASAKSARCDDTFRRSASTVNREVKAASVRTCPSQPVSSPANERRSGLTQQC